MEPAPHSLPQGAQNLEIALGALTPPLDWPALFGRGGPNGLEIGTGNGLFLAAEAARRPEMNFIGIERDPGFYCKMVKRCARAGLTNVRATRGDAIELLRDWLPALSLTRVYCYFSDPWPKRRHAERRVVNAALLPPLERVLAPGGEFWFKTDVGYYFNLAVTVFREREGWRLTELGRVTPADPARGEVVTNFERKAREAGSLIWGFHASRSLPPGAP